MGVFLILPQFFVFFFFIDAPDMHLLHVDKGYVLNYYCMIKRGK